MGLWLLLSDDGWTWWATYLDYNRFLIWPWMERDRLSWFARTEVSPSSRPSSAKTGDVPGRHGHVAEASWNRKTSSLPWRFTHRTPIVKEQTPSRTLFRCTRPRPTQGHALSIYLALFAFFLEVQSQDIPREHDWFQAERFHGPRGFQVLVSFIKMKTETKRPLKLSPTIVLQAQYLEPSKLLRAHPKFLFTLKWGE